MPNCSICGEKVPEGSRTCSVCGSSADEFLPLATMLHPDKPVVNLPAFLPPGSRYCPVCAMIYGKDYADVFCECGTELLEEVIEKPRLDEMPVASFAHETPPVPVDEMPLAPFDSEPVLQDLPPPPFDVELSNEPVSQDLPMAPILEDEPSVPVNRPPPGTPCLVLYGADKRPLRYFALAKDAIVIGRLDAVAGVFPDIDLDEWFDRATIRRISRQHAQILRSRATGAFVLRPYLGNTGTQLETQMLLPQNDYPLRPGHRIILGGVIRLKFEIT